PPTSTRGGGTRALPPPPASREDGRFQGRCKGEEARIPPRERPNSERRHAIPRRARRNHALGSRRVRGSGRPRRGECAPAAPPRSPREAPPARKRGAKASSVRVSDEDWWRALARIAWWFGRDCRASSPSHDLCRSTASDRVQTHENRQAHNQTSGSRFSVG